MHVILADDGKARLVLDLRYLPSRQTGIGPWYRVASIDSSITCVLLLYPTYVLLCGEHRHRYSNVPLLLKVPVEGVSRLVDCFAIRAFRLCPLKPGLDLGKLVRGGINSQFPLEYELDTTIPISPSRIIRSMRRDVPEL
jgi:hypothetical protein